MTPIDPRWREFPVVRAFFVQWRAARARGQFVQPFRRDWETLLEDAKLTSGEARREADREVRLVAASGLLRVKTARYREYQIERVELPLAHEPAWRALFAADLPSGEETRFDPLSVAWEPELAFVTSARLRMASEDLLKLNAFFAARGLVRLHVPIKERSLEIFGDEKRLDSLCVTTLFEPGRLTLGQLGCSVVPEPLGWQRGPCADGPMLVLENAATWESYTRWNRAHPRYSATVYGGGNRFKDSCVRLREVFDELGGARRVFYFGDLDLAGLQIPRVASQRTQQAGLPPVEPELWSYARLLEMPPEDGAAPLEPLAPDSADLAWLGNLAAPALAILSSGRRIPQEHLGWEYLSRCE